VAELNEKASLRAREKEQILSKSGMSGEQICKLPQQSIEAVLPGAIRFYEPTMIHRKIGR
jgi:hypothetical protein